MKLNFVTVFVLVVPLLILSACSTSHPLVDTPNLYTTTSGYPSENIPSDLQITTPEVFFVTDRQQETSPDGSLSYGTERSSSMAFGVARIAFGNDLTWEDLNSASSTATRNKDILLNLKNVEEIVRFPETPLPFFVQDGMVRPLPEVQDAYQNASQSMKGAIQNRLAKTKDKDVILFVHGFNNDFQVAALSMADIWHFTGRIGVPVFYTWPAASGGVFGYFKDREAGEFSIFHLKETLRILASTPNVERIHIIAHSRGTDITTTALRELVIEARASGKNPRQVLKIENLILAAPDLDFGVVQQRLIAEKFGPAIGQITVYMNQGDEALGLSQYLMAGLRFGKLAKNDLGENDKKIFKRIKNVNFINVEGVSSFVGHSYYREHPGVLSDIAIVIRNRLKPGDPGRPLIHDQINFWTLPADYPNH